MWTSAGHGAVLRERIDDVQDSREIPLPSPTKERRKDQTDQEENQDQHPDCKQYKIHDDQPLCVGQGRPTPHVFVDR
jgi:hypothetical protein